MPTTYPSSLLAIRYSTFAILSVPLVLPTSRDRGPPMPAAGAPFRCPTVDRGTRAGGRSSASFFLAKRTHFSPLATPKTPIRPKKRTQTNPKRTQKKTQKHPYEPKRTQNEPKERPKNTHTNPFLPPLEPRVSCARNSVSYVFSRANRAPSQGGPQGGVRAVVSAGGPQDRPSPSPSPRGRGLQRRGHRVVVETNRPHACDRLIGWRPRAAASTACWVRCALQEPRTETRTWVYSASAGLVGWTTSALRTRIPDSRNQASRRIP